MSITPALATGRYSVPMVIREADGQSAGRPGVFAAAAACALLLSLSCGNSRGSRDANADRVSPPEGDVADKAPDLPYGPGPEDRRDGATGPSMSGPERDGSTPSLDVAENTDQDGPRSLKTCGSYELVAAKPVSKVFSPSVRVGSRYAVLSTSSTRTDPYSSSSPHYFHDVIFSWFDPQTARFSESVTPFRMRGYNDGGVPIDLGSANPAAIITAPNGFALVWTAFVQGKTSLYFGLLDGAGETIGQPVMFGSEAERLGDVVWDGSQFAMAWVGRPNVLHVSRFDGQGNLVGTTDVAPTVYLGPVYLFWDGAAYGVFWENLLQALDEVWFARVDREGSLLLQPRLISPSDYYAGNLLVLPTNDGYLAYWTETPQSGTWFWQSSLHQLDRNGQTVAPARLLDDQPCGIAAMARSGADVGVVCSKNDAVGFAGLGSHESTQLTPTLSIGLPMPGTEGIRVAGANAFFGNDDGFDVFWTGTLDGATWGNYFTQIRCAK
jgi:hypothetical protein